MEMQHAIVVSLIGFFGSWAIVLGQSCCLSALISELKVCIGNTTWDIPKSQISNLTDFFWTMSTVVFALKVHSTKLLIIFSK